MPKKCTNLTAVGISAGFEAPVPTALFSRAIQKLPGVDSLKVIGCAHASMDSLLSEVLHVVCNQKLLRVLHLIGVR